MTPVRSETPTPPHAAQAPDLSAPDLAGVRGVVGNFRLEGHEIDPVTVALMVRAARGDLTTEQAIAETHARIARGEL